jgi:parallel beta-helix repeat protein
MDERRRRIRRRRVRCALAVIAAAAIAVTIADAQAASMMLFVDQANPNCSNTGTGSVTQPFCTISASGGKVGPGMTVQVGAGTYPERVSVKSGAAGAPIVYTAAPGATVTVGAGQANGFVASGKSWVTINGFNITQTTGYGIDISSGSANVTVSNNDVSDSGERTSGSTRYGIRASSATDCVISGNTVHDNSDTGIAVLGSSSRIQVLSNQTFENARGYTRAAAGIRVSTATDNTVAGNITHDNEDSGVESYPGAVNTLIYNNVSYDNGDHGFDNLGTANQRIIANTAYHNVTAGINVEGDSSGAIIKNNISVDNGIKSPRTHSNIRIERGSTGGAVVDSNLVWLTTADVLYVWDSTSYSTLAAFRTASGQGAHDIWADPKWRDLGARDFHLTWASPAVDSADSSASGQPATDLEGVARTDSPFVPNTGLGPRTYDDRGAYELGATDMDVPPTARVTLTPTSGVFPLNVRADASASTDPDATPIASYRFDFGDGTVVGPQPQATADHPYTSAGTYTVQVSVTDTAGNTGTTTAQETVQDDAPPTAALTVSPASGQSPLNVTANASASTDPDTTPVATYDFDFGDGTVTGPQESPTAGHTYTTDGTYIVRVTVADTAGNTGSATQQVVVGAATAVLSVSPTSGITPVAVTADASASSGSGHSPIASYTFDFGDGTVIGPQAGATATHTYTTGGTFTVKVTVKDTLNLTATATQQVAITRNFVSNAGFETNLTGWNTSGSDSGITLAQVTTASHSGAAAALLTNTASVPATCSLNDSPNWVVTTSAAAYTASLWVRADTPGATLNLRLREYAGSVLAGSAVKQITLTTGWQQVNVSYTPAAGSTLDLNAYVPKAAPGQCFYADDASITNG